MNGNGGEGLGFAFDFHTLFGFDGLMETIAPAAALHQASGKGIDNHHLIILHHIFNIFFIDTVGIDQLIDGMNSFTAMRKIVLQFLTAGDYLLWSKIGSTLEFGKRGGEVWHQKMFWIIRVERFAPFIGQAGIVPFFIDRKIKRLAQFARLLFIGIGDHHIIHLFEQATIGRFFDQFCELLIFRHPLMYLIKAELSAIGIFCFERIESILHKGGAQFVLLANQIADHTIERAVLLVGGVGGWAGNNERRTGFVDQNGIDFIDNCVVMTALLHHILGAHRHIIAEVIESKFAIRSIGDITVVLCSP